MVEQLLDAEAAVVGWDVIFPASVRQHVPGFDRELLLALRRGAQTGRIVLGKAQHSEQPILPFVGYRMAVGRGRNLHAVNLLTDRDGVARRVPLSFESRDGGPVPATRAGRVLHDRQPRHHRRQLPGVGRGAGGGGLGGYHSGQS